MGPGPSLVHPRVYRAMGAPVMGYADPVFWDILDDTKALLRRNDPDGREKLQWALGLRPWRLNRCLFVGVLPPP